MTVNASSTLVLGVKTNEAATSLTELAAALRGLKASIVEFNVTGPNPLNGMGSQAEAEIAKFRTQMKEMSENHAAELSRMQGKLEAALSKREKAEQESADKSLAIAKRRQEEMYKLTGSAGYSVGPGLSEVEYKLSAVQAYQKKVWADSLTAHAAALQAEANLMNKAWDEAKILNAAGANAAAMARRDAWAGALATAIKYQETQLAAQKAAQDASIAAQTAYLEKQVALNAAYAAASLKSKVAMVEKAAVYSSADGGGIGFATLNVGTAALEAVPQLQAMKAELAALEAANASGKKATLEHTAATRAQSQVLHEANGAVRGLTGSLGGLWLTYGSMIPLVGMFALTAAIKEVVTAGASFEYQMTYIQAITGETSEALDKASKTIKELGASSIQGPQELATGLRTLAEAGISVEDSMKALPSVMNLAMLGEITVAEAARTAQAAMHSYKLTVEDIPRIGDMLSKAAVISATDVKGMSAAMSTAVVAGAQFKISLQDTLTSLALMAQSGVYGTAAGTAFKNVVQELAAPTEKAAKAMKAIGIDAYDAYGKLKPVPEQIDNLREALQGLDEKTSNRVIDMLFGQKGGKGAAAMLTATSEATEALGNSILKSQGYMETATDKLKDTVEVKWKIAMNSMKDAAIDAFTGTRRELSSLADELTKLLRSQDFIDGLTNLVKGFGDLVKFVSDYRKEIVWALEAVIVWKLGSIAAVAAVGVGIAGVTTSVAWIEALSVGAKGGLLTLMLFGTGVVTYAATRWAIETAGIQGSIDKILHPIIEHFDLSVETRMRVLNRNIEELKARKAELGGAFSPGDQATLTRMEGALKASTPTKLDPQAWADAGKSAGKTYADGFFTQASLVADLGPYLSNTAAKSGPTPLVSKEIEKPTDKARNEAVNKALDEKKQALTASQQLRDEMEKNVAATMAEIVALVEGKDAQEHANRAKLDAFLLSEKYYKQKKDGHALSAKEIQNLRDEADREDALNVIKREQIKIAAELKKFTDKTDSEFVSAQKVGEEADAIIKYGLGAKATAVEIAELNIAKAKSNLLFASTVANQNAFTDARAVAGIKDVEDAFKNLATASAGFIKDTEKAEEDGRLLFMDREEQRIRYYEQVALRKMQADRLMKDSGYQTSMDALDLKRDDNGQLSGKDLEKYNELISAKSKADQQYETTRAKLALSTTAKINAANLKDWKGVVDKLEQIGHDGFLKVFDKIGGGWRSMLELLKGTFKNTLLEYIYKELAKPFILNVIARVAGVMGAQGLANSAMSAAGTAGNLASAGNTLYNVGSAGSGLSYGYNALAMSSAGQTLGLSSATAAGYSAPVYEAGTLVSAGSGTAAGGLTSLGTSIGNAVGTVAQAVPYIAAAYAIYTALDSFEVFGKAGGPQQGQYGTLTSDKGYQSSYTMSGGDSLGNAALTQSAYNQALSLFKMAGKDASGLAIGEGYKLDPQGTAAGQAYKDIYINGKVISGGGGISTPGWTGSHDDATGAASYLAKLNTAEILKLVDAIGDPGLSATVAKLAANFSDLNVGLTQYEAAMTTRDTLDTKLMTNEEKATASITNMNKAFAVAGIAVPKSAAEFRELLKSIDLTTQAGQDQINVLNGLSDAYVQANAAMQATDQTRATWQMKLDIMQGKYTQTQLDRFFQLLGTQDEATKSLMQQVWAMEDQTTAATAAADALSKMTKLAKDLSDVVDSLKIGDLSPLTNGQKLAEAQSQYTITLAQAQSGDATAQGSIGNAAQALLTQAHEYYASSASYTQLFEQVTGQLSALAQKAKDGTLPSLAVGTNNLPGDMVIKAHAGERVMPAADNKELFRRLSSPEQNSAALTTEIRALREEVKQLREESNRNAGMIASTVDRSGNNVADTVERSATQRKNRGEVVLL